MFEGLPAPTTLVFYGTTLATLLLFYGAIKNSNSNTTRKYSGIILIGLILWMIIQAVLTIQNVYNTNMDILPPKLLLFGLLPMILITVYLFATSKGRQFVDSLPLKNLTYLHVVRVPVEIVLFWLFIQKTVPQLMTFEGRNFDIMAGITAPFCGLFRIYKTKTKPSNNLNMEFDLPWPGNQYCDTRFIFDTLSPSETRF